MEDMSDIICVVKRGKGVVKNFFCYCSFNDQWRQILIENFASAILLKLMSRSKLKSVLGLNKNRKQALPLVYRIPNSENLISEKLDQYKAFYFSPFDIHNWIIQGIEYLSASHHFKW